ncbi:hypothetical protein AL036_12300 [Salipiger aestuarii]|nr:hypothetical protein AL036_12300 [Salipiger aestuarii]KAA8610764.1 hypothetical protein AL037_12360 [Salipiger aestuarii]KAB2541549.1 hypothetical protein AL035_11745 [Salipiger aestuarii]
MPGFALTPVSATALFTAACVAGVQYRRTWKADGPLWQLWVYGLIAAGGLLALAFLPLRP